MTPKGVCSEHRAGKRNSEYSIVLLGESIRMNRASIVVLLLSITSLSGQVKDIDGWEPTKWGMSLKQTREALAGRAEDVALEQFPHIKLRIPEIVVGGIPLSVNFEFTDAGGLRIVAMSVRDDFTRASAFDGLKQLLIEKYGPPSDQDAKTERDQDGDKIDGRTALWRTPSTTLLLKWSEYERHDIGSVMVIYSKVIKSEL
jgi:hypothetical protein